MMVDRVFTSIPCSRALVAKTWRRSWNRTFLHPACFRILASRWLTTEGATGASSFLGEGNIHCEKTVCLYSFSAVTTGGGKITVRMDALVLGGCISSSPLIWQTCRSIRSSPVLRFRSSHWSAISSPTRSPVVSSSRNTS